MQVLVMMPAGYQFQFMAENMKPISLHHWLISESANLSTTEVNPTEKEATRRWGIALTCKYQLASVRSWMNRNGRDSGQWWVQAKVLEVVVTVSLKLRDSDLFGAAITTNPMMISLEEWKTIGSTMELAKFRSSYRKW